MPPCELGYKIKREWLRHLLDNSNLDKKKLKYKKSYKIGFSVRSSFLHK